MESLQDILGTKNFKAPDESKLIKDYLERNYSAKSRIKVDSDKIYIQVFSSGLAATLQLEQRKIIAACGLKKKLIIRYGH